MKDPAIATTTRGDRRLFFGPRCHRADRVDSTETRRGSKSINRNGLRESCEPVTGALFLSRAPLLDNPTGPSRTGPKLAGLSLLPKIL